MNRSRCERGRLLDPQSFREAGDPAGHPDYRPGGSSRLSIVARAASTGNVTLQSPAAIGRIHSSVRSLSARAWSQPPADGPRTGGRWRTLDLLAEKKLGGRERPQRKCHSRPGIGAGPGGRQGLRDRRGVVRVEVCSKSGEQVAEVMIFRRFFDPKLAQASFLLGCPASREALIVDPSRSIDQYLRAAAEEHLRIAYVTETHIHADFVSGARELAHQTGARLYLSAAGGPDWQYQYAAEGGATLLQDDSHFEVGQIRVRVLHVPGHTPEHLCFLVTDGATADEPMGA